MPVVDQNLSILELKKLLQAEEEKLAEIQKQLAYRRTEAAGGYKFKTNKNGESVRVFTKKEEDELATCFNKFVDENGTITEDVFLQLCDYYYDDDDFKKVDADRDGKISFTDFITLLSKSSIDAAENMIASVLKRSKHLQAQFARSSLHHAQPYSQDEEVKVKSSITYGEFDSSRSTKVKAKVRPSKPEDHQKFEKTFGSDFINWSSKNPLDAVAISTRKDVETVIGRVILEVEDEAKAKALSVLLKNWMDDAYVTAIGTHYNNAFEEPEDPELLDRNEDTLRNHEEILNQYNILNKEDVDEYSGSCRADKVQLTKHLRRLYEADEFDLNCNEFERTGEGRPKSKNPETENGKLAAAIIFLMYGPYNNFRNDVVSINVSHDKNQIHIAVKLSVCGSRQHDLHSAIAAIKSEANLDIGIGGDFYGQVKDIIENDAMILEAAKWGIKVEADAQKGTDSMATLVRFLAHVLRLRLVNNEIVPTFLGWMIKDISSDIKLRNLLQTADKVVDFLVEETRYAFESNSGAKTYKWGDYENEQFDCVAGWAKFIVRAFQQRFRMSNEMVAEVLAKFMRNVEHIDKDDILEPLSFAKLISLKVSSNGTQLDATFSDNINLFAALPSMRVRDSFKSGERVCNIPQEFLDECKERAEELKDEPKIADLVRAFGPAMDYLESAKGATAMAKKEGLVLFSLLVKQLRRGSESKLLQYVLGIVSEKRTADSEYEGSEPLSEPYEERKASEDEA